LSVYTVLALPALGQDSAAVSRYQYIVTWDGAPTECDENAVTTFPIPYLQERDEWYGGKLRATGQGPLCAEVNPPETVFRLTWIPAFDPTAMVRIEKRDATYSLHAVRLPGARGSNAASARRDTTIRLTEADWETWLDLVMAARFWEATTDESHFVIDAEGDSVLLMGRDGAQWLLEAKRGSQYHAVDRWSPHAEPYIPFRKACEWLLNRSGLVDSALVAQY